MSELKFDSASALIKYLNVSRPTAYRRAKEYDISLSKGTYSEQDIEQLRKPISNRPKEKHDELSVKLLQKQLETAQKTIETQQKQLEIKDEQIQNANSLANQAQLLQKDLQNKLGELNNRLENSVEQPEIESKKGFWHKLFG